MRWEWRKLKSIEGKNTIRFNNLYKTGESTAEAVLLDKKGQPHYAEYSSKTVKDGDKVVRARALSDVSPKARGRGRKL